MRITLVRHGRVHLARPRWWVWMGHRQVVRWFADYDAADSDATPVQVSAGPWQACYASPLRRAQEMAQAITTAPITTDERLREVDTLPGLRRWPHMPWRLWLPLMRYYVSRGAVVAARRQDAAGFIDDILARHDGEVLVVSHHFIMLYLRQELLRRGFAGPAMPHPQHGVSYVFVRGAEEGR